MNNSTPTSFNFIGENTELNGDLYLKGDTHIYGKVKGNITGDKDITLTVEYTGQVEGNISNVNVVILGQVLGNIIESNRIEATSSARVKGIISGQRFQIFPGAKIRGEIKSLSSTKTQPSLI